MILIKLSAHRNMKVIMAMLSVLILVITVKAVSSEVKDINNKVADSREPSVTESYEPETQDDSTEDTEPAIETETSEIEDVVETTPPAETTAEESTHIQYYTEQDVIDIAKVLYRECRGIESDTEKACVVWTILNRVDTYSSNVYSVVREANQYAFSENTPVWDELVELARDVLERWNFEKNGEECVGRVLPKEYLYFEGDGTHNYFKDNHVYPCNIWNYSIESPYEN